MHFLKSLSYKWMRVDYATNEWELGIILHKVASIFSFVNLTTILSREMVQKDTEQERKSYQLSLLAHSDFQCISLNLLWFELVLATSPYPREALTL